MAFSVNAPTLDQTTAALKKAGFVLFSEDDTPYNLNIVGVRTLDPALGSFNDWLCVFFKYLGVWHYYAGRCTTEPGLYYSMTKLLNPEGAAIIKEGQYRAAYKFGLHKGKPALEQIKPVPVYRDGDRNSVRTLTPSALPAANNKTNIHYANAMTLTPNVGRWSAGCVVIQDWMFYRLLMNLAETGAKLHGNAFTFTLLDESAHF